MLERLLPWWQGKLFVLVLLGFVATDFIITITLSAADATAHLVENPFAPHCLHGHQVADHAVADRAARRRSSSRASRRRSASPWSSSRVYLALNVVVIGDGLSHDRRPPATGRRLVAAADPASTATRSAMIGVALLVFPKLALGLSGFETGVAVMPLVEGEPTTPDAARRAASATPASC